MPFAEEGARAGAFWVARVELEAVSGDGERWQQAAGGLSVFVNGGPPAGRVGDTVRFLASVRRNRAPTNPGERDSALSYARSGSYGMASVPSPEGVAVVARAPWYNLSAAVARLRARVDERLQQEMGDADAIGIVQGLLTGERNGLSQRQTDLLKESGTMQFLAVSGLHVGIFCLFIGAVLVWTGVSIRLRALLTIALVWLYVLFTGFQVPAVRAGWMISFVLAAPLLERRRDSASGLACAALLILIYQPQQLFVAGFQLTFVAMWAMMCIYPQLAGIFWPWQDFEADAQAPAETYALAEVWLYTRSYLLLSVTVWLASAPILVYQFNMLSYAAPLLNLAIWPLVLLLMLVCFVFVGSMMAFGLGAGALAWAATLLSRAIQTLLEASSHLPGYGVYVPDVPLWWVALFFVAMTAWVMRWRTRWGRVSFIVVVLVLSLSYVFNDAAARAHRQFRLTLLDVGHGQAVLVELPTGETVLLDAGAEGGGAAGARALAEVLWHRHVDHLDAVCISHMDADHLDFLPFLARRFTIGKLVVPRAGELGALGVTVRQWAREERLDLEVLGEGDEVRGGALLCRVLHPSPRFAAAGSVSENSRSLVLRCEYEGLTFLVPGDVEDDAMQRLVRDYGDGLAADVLVLPHHGLAQAGLGAFVRQVAPQVALASGPEGRGGRDGRSRRPRAAGPLVDYGPRRGYHRHLPGRQRARARLEERPHDGLRPVLRREWP